MAEIIIITDLKLNIQEENYTVLAADEVKKKPKKIFRLRRNFFSEIRFYTYDLSLLPR